jgi:GntR family transcriptional regulator
VNRLSLDEGSNVPLYHQLREQLRAMAAERAPDTVMPSEKELVERLAVSRATARRAIADLIYEGVLYARQGRGTFVAAPRVQTRLERPAGFTETMTALGHAPSTRVLGVSKVQAPVDVVEALGLAPNAEVFVLERLRLLDGEPCMLERAHIPVRLAPALDRQDLTGSLYDLLEREYGLVPAGGQEIIVAVNAQRDAARMLNVPLASALLSTAARRSVRAASGSSARTATRAATCAPSRSR